LLAIKCCDDVLFAEALKRFVAGVHGFLSQAEDVESEMNQPAKAQEPSMEEILASIRRIISDDEAKPAAAAPAKVEPAKPEPAKPAVAKPAAAKAESPRPAPVPEPKPAVPRPAAAAPVKAPEPAPAEKNSQAEIDAMMASFDAPEPAAPVAEPDSADSDVFELTEQMAVPEADSAAFQKVEPDDDLEFAESVAATPHATRIDPPSYDRPIRSQPLDVPSMLSSTAAASVESAFNALASTVLSNNARTLEDLVKDMLRPMLKSWLDDNLPGLVERIVRAEIERVSRGR
jgi:cell pole-organizing protein PopZ